MMFHAVSHGFLGPVRASIQIHHEDRKVGHGFRASRLLGQRHVTVERCSHSLLAKFVGSLVKLCNQADHLASLSTALGSVMTWNILEHPGTVIMSMWNSVELSGTQWNVVKICAFKLTAELLILCHPRSAIPALHSGERPNALRYVHLA